jgi:glycosyltransferase involved in cell wall biosynthesis
MERGLAIVEAVEDEHDKNEATIVDVSVVIPISERHDDLKKLYLEYARELSASGVSAEFIFVLDGVDIEVLRVLKILKKDYSNVAVVTLNRSFGEATALSAGFQRAKGKFIVTIASYFQVKPVEVRRVLAEVLEDKADLVVAWRNPRIDPMFNRIQSRIYHWIVRSMIGTQYHDVSCGLRGMKRIVADEISLYGDLHRFFPISAYQRGFRVTELAVCQSPLDVKRRTQSPGVYLRRLLDILTFFFLFKFTKKPLRFFGVVGSGIFAAGAMITAYLWLERLLGIPLAGRPMLILGILLMVFGIQLFSAGLLGEIIIFTHAREVKDYQIREILD